MGRLYKNIGDISEIYKINLRDRKFIASLLLGLCLLAVSLFINYYAGIYATEKASNSVTDIFLSNIPVFDVDGVFVYGALIFWIWILLLILKDIRLAPFITRSVAIFVIIRSFFITLTHLGPFPEQSVIVSNFILNRLTFGGDLFFSGHTGLPFLMALLFWRNTNLRYTFLFASIVFGVSVILGHYHYSIDVFAAYFITYSIFHITQYVFPEDYRVFKSVPMVRAEV